MRGKAWRRAQNKRVQRKRYRIWTIGYGPFDFEWANNPIRYGMFRKTHFGCGCFSCKPWKHGCLDKYDRFRDD